jgi:drug/metabolite transporter (DMT)-like permease
MKPRVLALTAVLFWSTAASAFKLTLRWLSPYELVLLSSTVSAVALWLAILIRKNGAVEDRSTLSTTAGSAVRGLLNPFVYYLVLLTAYNELPAQVAMVINYFWPVTLMLFSAPLLNQRINLKMITASAISFCGIAILAFGGNPVGGSLKLSAMGLALLSTVLWSLFWVLNVRAKRDTIRSLAESFAFGCVYLLVYGIVTGELSGITNLDVQGIAGSIYIGLFEMGITFVIWLKALELSKSTSDVGMYIYITPFLALLFIQTVVGEKIGIWTVAGLVLVISGIVLKERGRMAPRSSLSEVDRNA